eukprot:Protomagalhaensia_sp_Gyna_25__5690@NODE_809_length_2570_cov_14_231134_g637_i0_p4_GENE_NODE_809_length_2570_cov_14_231134_g637_i0NODE_809_length_2570_cov_14_231134_g637_i0_p4_ORF_typecomplete_len121_score6_72_NODE_809_length_2570_cov_14_231134_g637_i013221684
MILSRYTCVTYMCVLALPYYDYSSTYSHNTTTLEPVILPCRETERASERSLCHVSPFAFAGMITTTATKTESSSLPPSFSLLDGRGRVLRKFCGAVHGCCYSPAVVLVHHHHHHHLPLPL